jgi:hypothetical protein
MSEPAKAGMARLNIVKVQLGRELIEVPWSSRDALLVRLRAYEEMGAIVQAFEAVGTSRPVIFKPEHKPVLLGAVEAWLEDLDASDVPAGIIDLKKALRHERDAPSRTT